MRACNTYLNERLFAGWIPTLTNIANFDFSLKSYLRARKSVNKCYISIHLKINNNGKHGREASFSICNIDRDDFSYVQLDESNTFFKYDFVDIIKPKIPLNSNPEYEKEFHYKLTLLNSIIELSEKKYDFNYGLPKSWIDDSSTPVKEAEYEILCYPKITRDSPKRLEFPDSVIIVIGKKENKPVQSFRRDLTYRLHRRNIFSSRKYSDAKKRNLDCIEKKTDDKTTAPHSYLSIESVIIIDLPFKDFFSRCLKSNVDQIPIFGMGNIHDMDTHGLFLYEICRENLDEITKNEYSKLIDIGLPEKPFESINFEENFQDKYKQDQNLALARQIFVIISDIYHIKVFHSSDIDVVNDVINIQLNHCGNCEELSCKETRISLKKCESIKKTAVKQLRYNYSKKIVIFTNLITMHSKIPFYHYLSYGLIRDIQDDLRTASGEMLFGRYFVKTYFRGDDGLIRQFDIATRAIAINAERLENKWTFTMLLPLVAVVDAGIYYLLNIMLNMKELTDNQQYILNYTSSVILILFLIPALYLIAGFTALYLKDFRNHRDKLYRKSKSKIEMSQCKKEFFDINCKSNSKDSMYISDSQSRDAIQRLLKFITCLAIAGTVIGLTVYFVLDLPVQQTTGIHAPLNCMWSQCY